MLSVVCGNSVLLRVSVVTVASVAEGFGLIGVSALNVLEDSVFIVISGMVGVSGI